MKDKWNAIPNIIGDSLVLMLEGGLVLILFLVIYGFGYWVLFLLGVNKSWDFGNGTILALFLLCPFSIALCATLVDRENDGSRRGERMRLNNQLQQLSWDDSEINRRVSELVDRLEEGELDPDDKNVDLDTVELINDTRRELEDIRDQLF